MRTYLWFALLAIVGCNDNNDNHLVTRTDIATDATDPTLINAWGLAFNPSGVAWVSANGTGVSVVYNADGGHVIPPITIPGPSIAEVGAQATPTGQVFNGNGNAFLGDAFIFATEDGTISAWQPVAGTAAVSRIDNSPESAVYKGVAIGQALNGDDRLYATNFHAGTVDVYDSSYHLVQGGFVDSQLPDGFAPFNVAVVPGGVLVSYALQDADKHDDVPGAGNGFVDLYDGDGNLLTRLISGVELNSPWGMTISPSSFTAAQNNLLVGNFGDGLIHVYDFNSSNQTATFRGVLNTKTATPIAIDGLWALQFGPGAGGFDSDVLYFTAGPASESEGVFGSLTSRSD